MDGGGSWALIQVMALQNIFGAEKKGHDVLAEFDLVCANSGGSIVLAGLIENYTLSEILEFFTSKEKRYSVFVKRSWPLVQLSKLSSVIPRYYTPKKLKGLEKFLPRYGARNLNNFSGKMENNGIWPKLMICAFDYDTNRAVFFRSDNNSLAAGTSANWSPTIAEAIHASSNAPVAFFNKPAIFPHNANAKNKQYWDGAIGGFNNPVLAGTCEALANADSYNCNAASIMALSIGTGITIIPRNQKNKPVIPIKECNFPKFIINLKKLAKSILSDPPDTASYITHIMLGGKPSQDHQEPSSHHIIRMNPAISPIYVENKWKHPINKDPFDSLVSLEMDAIEDSEVALIQQYCNAWLVGTAPNQAIRADDLLRPLIGHSTFLAAKNDWLKLLE